MGVELKRIGDPYAVDTKIHISVLVFLHNRNSRAVHISPLMPKGDTYVRP